MEIFRKFFLLSALFLLLFVFPLGCAEKMTKQQKRVKEIKPKEEVKKGGVKSMFTLKSPSFEDGGKIPVKYANTGVSGGENISIPFHWENPPEGTKSFALAIVDIHPIANNWVHWLVINIPHNVTFLPEGASRTNKMPAGSKELNNSWGVEGYGGPQPPPGTGDHEYVTTIYALDVENLPLQKNISLNEFSNAIKNHTLAQAEYTGKFGR